MKSQPWQINTKVFVYRISHAEMSDQCLDIFFLDKSKISPKHEVVKIIIFFYNCFAFIEIRISMKICNFTDYKKITLYFYTYFLQKLYNRYCYEHLRLN